MKLCFFLTSHGRSENYEWQALAYKKFKYIKNFDIIIHDNSNISKETLTAATKNLVNIKCILSNEPNHGYYLGQLNAINNYYYLLKEYDYVIHHVHDFFFLDDSYLRDWLENFQEYPGVGFLTNQFPFHPSNNKFVTQATLCLASDCFIFDPKIANDFFWKKTLSYGNIPPELILYKATQELNIPVIFWPRLHKTKSGRTLFAPKPQDLENLHKNFYPDTIGTMHNHNYDILKLYLE